MVIEFDWDDPRTVDIDYAVSEQSEERFRVVGMTQSGRMLSAVYAVRNGRIRAVTAFSAGRKEIAQWRRMQNE